MSAAPSFSEADALRHVAASADLEQLRNAVLAVIDAADSGGYVEEVRDLKHHLWSALTAEPTILAEHLYEATTTSGCEQCKAEAEKKPDEPDVHAVTGTYHPVGPVRSGPVGRRKVGFQHREPR